MVLFTIPTVVLLSMCIGVDGCGCPSLLRTVLMILASCALKNKAPSSAPAVEAATSLSMVHVMCTAPFSHLGSLSRVKEEVPSGLTPCSGCREVGGIGMDVEYHIRCFKSDGGIWMGGHII